MARLSPVQLSSKAWAYINTGSVDIYFHDSYGEVRNYRVLKSHIRKLLPFLKARTARKAKRNG